ncbi:3-hydroxyacyl-CoA dehydrogenase NAD-binding domain-containing protein (plasmid) [Alicyclobacillus fastidiosus]|uniref:3-hydroxyacyl-CoA dehydrogenase NAD-binding domain-containing protein n=1 Tax=Alicyclobacillus fastidiosus TaxID=392011 RepID=A0ABY6ZRJ1_9BACL|nr:3-hydroxyacyl-CoA dehydrogenase NAD-binding domain-containing protein [Alicyclobacillus fastidiosus]WAH44781.1 3-hydroxyacyl-CoA dehydrogenase NAD-binding domain-containing protein [Alicyclobacillus fastidiosus]GMA65735.1 butyryl-CoA dehydrogenase [Alicyclobacillus fastidiosus]GMA65908.1 butyryl-CoA dehydrogenase [Alicyclobacillus fastidiosus]
MSSQERLSIVGSGIMGHSIALTAAWAGFDVKVWGVDAADIERAREGLKAKLDLLAGYDVLAESEKERIFNAITFTDSLNDCVANATFVIEAIPEKIELKQEYFKNLDEICPENTIIASNTSGLSATEIAKYTKNPSRTVVTHFWNPAHLMPLVEVVRGEHTSDETAERAMNLLKAMNKKPILVKKDVLGSVGNRLQYAIFREAQYILEEGIASMEDIDAAIRYSLGRRFGVTGPFMTMDMTPLTTISSITSYLFRDLSDRKDSFPTLEKLVADGHNGTKTGKGFYDWTPELVEKMNYERERELIRWLKQDIEEAKKETK